MSGSRPLYLVCMRIGAISTILGKRMTHEWCNSDESESVVSESNCSNLSKYKKHLYDSTWPRNLSNLEHLIVKYNLVWVVLEFENKARANVF